MISVIVPVYKVEKYLNRCVDSILKQSYYDFTLILVDDGSPDNCPAICDEYAKKDSRIVVIHKENGGISSARNAGLDYIFDGHETEWVAFVDSDDYVTPDYLSALYNLTQKYSVSCAACGYAETEGDEIVTNENFFEKVAEPDNFVMDAYSHGYKISSISAWGKLYKLSLFKDVRFPLGKISEDRATTYKTLFKCEKIAYSDKPVYMYYQSPNSLTRSAWTSKKMDDFEAFGGQLEFFKNGSYKQALTVTLYQFFYNACVQLDELLLLPEYKSYYKKIQKQFKSYMRKYGKELGFRMSKNLAYYKHIYPVTTKVILFSKKVLRSVKK